MGKATILGFSPNLAAMISAGGRISTMEGTAGQIWQKSLELGEEKNERLIGKVVSSGHTSVLEHGYVNLSFEDVSVFAEQFLIEFRLASFTVKSRRYVDFSNCGWVTPFADAARAAVYDAEAVWRLRRAVRGGRAEGGCAVRAALRLPQQFLLLDERA